MKNGKPDPVRKIMMSAPVTLTPDDTLDLANDIMTVGPDTPIKDAARLMADKKIGCVPVIHKGALVGLVTTTNILRYLETIA